MYLDCYSDRTKLGGRVVSRLINARLVWAGIGRFQGVTLALALVLSIATGCVNKEKEDRPFKAGVERLTVGDYQGAIEKLEPLAQQGVFQCREQELNRPGLRRMDSR